MNLNNANETLAAKKPVSVTVLGAGAWGTALALLCARNGHHVTLWCLEQEVADDIAHNKKNDRYLSGIDLDSSIETTTDLAYALQDSFFIIEAIPVAHLRTILEQARSFYHKNQRWIVTSKGIEQETLLLPTDIVNDVLGTATDTIVLSGPSFAREIAQQQPTTVDIGTTDARMIAELTQLLCNDYFSINPCNDPIGMQVGGALKNVIAIGVGILDGAGYTGNAKAAFITHGLQEMGVLTKVLGGNKETIYGLSGVGDLMLTTTGSLSKNLAIGKRIGAGDKLADIQKEGGQLPEGINTIKSVQQLARKLSINLPLCTAIYQVVVEEKEGKELVRALF